MTTPVQIPDAAVQAASKAYCDGYDAYDDHDKAVNAAITAALPHLQLGFEVKAGYRVDAYDLQMNGKSVPLERALSCEATKTVDVASVQSSALIELLDDMRFTLENMGSTDETDAYLIERILAHVDNLRSLSAEPAQGEQWHPTHRHVKRDTDYQLIGTGKMQAEAWFDYASGASADMQKVAIYRGDDGQLWVRPIAEFIDGRFEPLSAAPTSEEEA